MIEAIQGKIAEKQPHRIVIEQSGVFFELSVSFHTSRLLPQVGNKAKLLCHLNWRENEGPQLFGFYSDTERSFFRMLTKVNKVGPKLAMNIISADTPENLATMILNEDVKRLTALKGVGPKLASRLIVELKENIAKLGLAAENITQAEPVKTAVPFEEDVRAALESLGYTGKEITKALKKLAPGLQNAQSIEDVIEKVLRMFADS